MKKWALDTLLELKIQIAKRCGDANESIEIEYINPQYPDEPLRLTGPIAEYVSRIITCGLEHVVSENGLTDE